MTWIITDIIQRCKQLLASSLQFILLYCTCLYTFSSVTYMPVWLPAIHEIFNSKKTCSTGTSSSPSVFLCKYYFLKTSSIIWPCLDGHQPLYPLSSSQSICKFITFASIALTFVKKYLCLLLHIFIFYFIDISFCPQKPLTTYWIQILRFSFGGAMS